MLGNQKGEEGRERKGQLWGQTHPGCGFLSVPNTERSRRTLVPSQTIEGKLKGSHEKNGQTY